MIWYFCGVPNIWVLRSYGLTTLKLHNFRTRFVAPRMLLVYIYVYMYAPMYSNVCLWKSTDLLVLCWCSLGVIPSFEGRNENLRLTPDTVTYNAALSACEKGHSDTGNLGIFRWTSAGMRKSKHPSVLQEVVFGFQTVRNVVVFFWGGGGYNMYMFS